MADLAPLRGMLLINLAVPYTNVSDLSPLKGMPLEILQCQGSKVTDLSPVKDSPLKTINDKPAAEFWKIGRQEH